MSRAAVHAFIEGEDHGRALAHALDCPFGRVDVHRFPDGEVLPSVPEVAETVIVYRSLDRPNEKLVELVLAAEAWRRLGARRLVLVAPYLAYMRQDAVFRPGQAISQSAVGRLLSGCFDRVVTVNAHLHRTRAISQVFADIPAQNLSIGAALGRWLHARLGKDITVVAPDEEAAPLVREVAEAIGAPWLALAKTRHGDRSVALAPDAGERLEGRTAAIVDDICSTGVTLAAAAERATRAGAGRVEVFAVHALFDALAEARLRAAGVSAIASSDSVPHPSNALALAPLLAEALAPETAK